MGLLGCAMDRYSDDGGCLGAHACVLRGEGCSYPHSRGRKPYLSRAKRIIASGLVVVTSEECRTETAGKAAIIVQSRDPYGSDVSPVHRLQCLEERLVLLAALRADREVMRDGLKPGRDRPAGELSLGELGDQRQAPLAIDLAVLRQADLPHQFVDYFLRE